VHLPVYSRPFFNRTEAILRKDFQWIFFDVGSTLVDESACYELRLRQLAREAGLPYEALYQQALAAYRQNQKGDLICAQKLGLKLPPWPAQAERTYPDAVPCLERLRQHYHIGIIANQEPGCAQRLAAQGLLPFVELLLSSAEEGLAKPDPRLFQRALERAQCPASQALMVGDRIDNDIVPAKALGFGTVWLRQGFGQYWQLQRPAEQPDASAASLTELCGLLLD